MTALTLTPITPGTLSLTAFAPSGPPINILNSATYGAAYSFGNTPGSFTFSGSGSPLDIYAPVVIYQRYGVNNPNAPVTKTTQAWYSSAAYYGPPTDDSSECGSCFVSLKDTGTPFTSTKPHTAFEAIAQLEGGNQVTGASVVGLGSRINLTGTSHADTIEFVHMSKDATGGGGGTVTNAYGLRQLTAFGATNINRAVDAIDDIATQSRFVLGRSGDGGKFEADWAGNTGSAFVFMQSPDGTDTPTLRIQGTSGQVHGLAEFWKAGNASPSSIVSSAGGFITFNSAGFLAQTSGGANVAGMNQDGVFTAKNAAPADANIANGLAFLWLDATPGATKLMVKAKDSAGTVRTGSLALT